MSELARLSALRMRLLDLHPFWGHLLLQVRLVAAPGLPAIAATDCVRHIWFDPERTAALSDAQLGFVLAHEVGHQLLASGERQRGRRAHVWNCATDYAINRLVACMRDPADWRLPLWEPPDGVLLDPRFDGRIAEVIYEHLLGDALPAPTEVAVTLGEATLPRVSDHGGGIDVHLPVSLDPEDRDVLRERIAAAVEAWEQSEQRGDMPGGLVRALGLQGRTRVPWQRLLRRYVGQALTRDDWSLAHPSRRWLAEDIVVPGLGGSRAGWVVVAVDTSGSMSPADLDAMAAELRAISREVEELTLIVADTKVREVVPPAELDRFLHHGKVRGGGGTDHRPVFAWVRERGIAPDVFIGLTDLYTRLPDHAPPYPVVWVTPTRHGAAPWGRVVALGSDR
ncbi:MAG: hypothetical protein AMXMBFR64_23640 [Myxococcales bacterium]